MRAPSEELSFVMMLTCYRINLQSLEDTQVGYISQKYTLAPKSLFIKDNCCTVMSKAVEIQKYHFAKIHLR